MRSVNPSLLILSLNQLNSPKAQLIEVAVLSKAVKHSEENVNLCLRQCNIFVIQPYDVVDVIDVDHRIEDLMVANKIHHRFCSLIKMIKIIFLEYKIKFIRYFRKNFYGKKKIAKTFYNYSLF